METAVYISAICVGGFVVVKIIEILVHSGSRLKFSINRRNSSKKWIDLEIGPPESSQVQDNSVDSENKQTDSLSHSYAPKNKNPSKTLRGSVNISRTNPSSSA